MAIIRHEGVDVHWTMLSQEGLEEFTSKGAIGQGIAVISMKLESGKPVCSNVHAARQMCCYRFY